MWTPRLALKPDRTIVVPGDPGWDDLPPNRPRSDWWRSILSGHPALNRKPGCCCTTNPCLAPKPASITLTDSVLGTFTLTPSGGFNGDYGATVAGFSSPGTTCCPAITVTYYYDFWCAHPTFGLCIIVTVGQTVTGPFFWPNCPAASTGGINGSVPVTLTGTLSPLNLTGSRIMTNSGSGTAVSAVASLYGACTPTSVPVTMTVTP